MQLLRRLTKASLERKIISKEDIELYEFGVKSLAASILNYATFFLIAVLTENMLPMLIYLCAFKPLRTHAGGLHLETRLSCYAASNVLVLLTSLLFKSRIMDNYVFISFVGIICAYICIMILCPVETYNRPLDEKEVEVYGHRTKLILNIEMVLSAILLFVGYIHIFNIFAMVIMQVALTLLLGLIKNRFFTRLESRNYSGN